MESPEFPLRIIFDDGAVQEITHAEELMEAFESVDSTDPANRIWIRDAFDRTVRLRMQNGRVEILEAE